MTAALTDAAGETTAAPAPTVGLAGLDRAGLVGIAAGKLAFHLGTAALYGLHRDEFYYLAAGQHPAAGYVDQPPLTPLLYRGWSSLFGASQLSLHSLAAVMSVPLVVLAALLARELGGSRWAQRMTMTVAAVGTAFTTTFHFASTVTADVLLWTLATWLVLRLLRTGDPRLWLPVGAVAGVAFENKHSIVIWGVAVAVGMLITDRRGLLWTPWLLAGAAAFAVIAAPNLVWQATHDWASLSFYSALRRRTGRQNLVQFLPLQLGLMSIAGTVLVVRGLRWLRREPDGTFFRPLWIAFAAVLLIFFVSSGKGYYTAGIYLPVVAAGAVAFERAGSALARRRLITAVVVTGALLAPVFTPMLPASTAVKLGLTKTNPDLGAMLGWHRVVDRIAAVYRSLPLTERASAVFLTRDYSEASALYYWRRSEGIPAAISGHNNEWWWGWGPAAHATTVVAVGLTRDSLGRWFTSVRPAGTLTDADGPIDPDQLGLPIWVCTGRRAAWPAIWPSLRLYA